MLKNFVLLGGVAAGLLLSVAASAAPDPLTPTYFSGPVNLSDTTTRQVFWQTETTPCRGNDQSGPDMIRGTGDDISPLATSFILDPGCAVAAAAGGAQFNVNLATDGALGLPANSTSNGFAATFTSDGVTGTVTVPASIWGPVLKNSVDVPGLVTVTPGTVSAYVFTIDVGTGNVTSFSWTANAMTVLGPATLNVALMAGPGSYYSAEAASAPAAAGATVWACGTGGFIATPANTPGVDPGSLGTCPPDPTNPSLTLANASYNPATGTLTSNASSAVLAITPRAWAPLDGRLSEIPEPGTMLLIGSGLLGLGAFGRRKSA